MSEFFKSIFTRRENGGIKLIIFDFDGTLVDTRELLLRIVKKRLGEFNYELSKDLIKKFGDSPMDGFLKRTGLKNEMIKEIAKIIHDDYLKEHKKIKPCKNLFSLKDIEKRKIILSNNITPFITASLKFLQVDFFDEVYGGDKFTTKAKAIKKMIKKYGLAPEDIVYVGDRAIDVVVARGAGCYGVIVSNKSSLSPRKEILKKHPDFMIDDLGHLKKILLRLDSTKLAVV